MNISRRKFFAFALTAMSLSVAAALMLLLIADLVVHHRAERSAGLNRWGYRGKVAASKKSGELRAVMLGGSTVFGYGVQPDQSIPASLERTLNASRPFSVINLGFNNEGAYSFVPTLQDFEYLDYDIVVLYEGYNDLPGDEKPNTAVFRHDSGVFRLTGYLPILPMYLEEKAMTLRYGGDLGAAYAAKRGETPKTVFRPNIAARTTAGAFDTVATVTNSLGEQLGRLSKTAAPAYARVSLIGCSFPWVNYCDSVHAAVRHALSQGKRVIVVAQPRTTGAFAAVHVKQRHMLGAMVRAEFASEPRVAYVDLGDAVDLMDPALSFDEMHLTPDGNRKLAAALAPHVLALAEK
jgi:lysophospholipase L1-like esterase